MASAHGTSSIGVVTVLGASIGTLLATPGKCDPPRGTGVFALLQPVVKESASAFGTDYSASKLYNQTTLGTLGVNGIVLSIPWSMLNNDIQSCSSVGTCTLTSYCDYTSNSCSIAQVSPTRSNSAYDSINGTLVYTEAADARLPGTLDWILTRVKNLISNNQNVTLNIALQAGAWTPLQPNPSTTSTFVAMNGLSINGSTTETLVPYPGHLITSPYGGTLSASSLLQELQDSYVAGRNFYKNGFVYADADDGTCDAIASPWAPVYTAEYNAALSALVYIIKNQYGINVPKVISISGINERSAEIGFFGDLNTGTLALTVNPPSSMGPSGTSQAASVVDESNCNSMTSVSNSERWHSEGYDPSLLEISFASIAQNVKVLLNGAGALTNPTHKYVAF